LPEKTALVLFLHADEQSTLDVKADD
jgi:hypothetical protein